jgi:hypothetical protein
MKSLGLIGRNNMSNRISIEVLHQVKMSKGEFTLPYLSIMFVEATDDYCWVQHKKSMYPTGNSVSTKPCGVSSNYLWNSMSFDDVLVLQEAMVSWKENKNNEIMCYSYAYAYCKAKGLDLHKDLGMM